MDVPGNLTRRSSGTWCLQKESSSPTAATPTAASGSHRFDFGESSQHSNRAVGLADLADQQRDGCLDRRHWRCAGERIAECVADGLDHLSSDGEGCRRDTRSYGAADGNAATATAASTADGYGSGTV